MKVLEQVHDGGDDEDGDDDGSSGGGFQVEEKGRGVMIGRVNVARLRKDGLA